MSSKSNDIISIIHPICCGLDVHKKNISACLITVDEFGKEEYHLKEFATFTDDLYKLKEWLIEHECPIVAIESTGVYWRPVHNVLEDVVKVVLVNAGHAKNLPGKKTDISDSKWLAGLIRCGLVKGSFIPEKEVRQWRELTRLRKSYTKSVGDYKRRVHKLFECANIKISAVASDLFGVTGRNLIDLLCHKENELTLDDVKSCAKGALRKQVEELYRSINGFFEEHHRFQLILLMDTITMLETRIVEITARLSKVMTAHDDLIERLDDIPGINILAAQTIISETGVDLDKFPSHASLASWGGLCPGNNETGGKRKSGKTAIHNHPFKTILIEVSWAAIKKKGSYFKDKYYRLRARRGSKKAIVAIAHKISKAIYYIIKFGRTFNELGEDYLNKKNESKKLKRLQQEANKMGYALVAVN